MASVENYAERFSKPLIEFRRFSRDAAFATSQEKVLKYFLDRATQLGEACLLVGQEHLGTPLFALMRVLCEDLLITAWVATSTQNTDEYVKGVLSQVSKTARVQLDRGRARIVNRTTGEDETAAFRPELSSAITAPSRVEQIATEAGLLKVYDAAYRGLASLEVHGNSFGLPSSSDETALVGAFAAVLGFLNAIMLIVQNRVVAKKKTEPSEVLETLAIHRLGGK
jgi:hypothetical protein